MIVVDLFVYYVCCTNVGPYFCVHTHTIHCLICTVQRDSFFVLINSEKMCCKNTTFTSEQRELYTQHVYLSLA